MIRVHHLNNSRSQRILWALEELGLDYEIVKHQRNPETNLAPESLLAVHALGKAPMIEDGKDVIVESAAILEYLSHRHAGGRLSPKVSSPDWPRYVQLLHYAEGSAMLPLMLKLYLGRLGAAADPLQPRVTSETLRHIGWLDAQLLGRDFFVGVDLSLADIQLTFVIQAARLLHGLDRFPNLGPFVARMVARPAYARALERGGPSMFA
jgi:glutathione S-transferase